MTDRDPRMDPRAGDCVHKDGSRGPVKRYVAKRDGTMVYYRSVLGGMVKECWLVTWMDWARDAEVGDGPDDPLREVVPPAATKRERRRVADR